MKNCICLLLLAGAVGASGQPGVPDRPVKVNRTVPKIAPPRLGLEFSARPTVQEISRARVFEEPLVLIGGEPKAEENAALAEALLGYAKRSGPDDFSSLTEFLERHPQSPWRTALLTGLGFEYYTTAHYSLALEAWSKALEQAKDAVDGGGRVVLARASEELALLYARLGRMTELEALLRSIGAQNAPGASERINLARDALWMMQNRPEVSFRCGPLALQRILQSDQGLLTSTPRNNVTEDGSFPTNAMMGIFNSASTHQGFSLPQVAELSKKAGMNYQMAFRRPRSGVRPSPGAGTSAPIDRSEIIQGPSAPHVPAPEDGSTPFVVPSVVHWKVGHYAALVRQEGDRYLLEDPTFGNSVWATRKALEAETSGYFLIPPGDLPRGWRGVDAEEGASVWGKGVPGGNDGDVYTPNDLQTGGSCPVVGMPVASVHLMTVNGSISDTPLAYTPPVGPPVRFTFRYNSRDLYATEGLFGGHYWNGLGNTNVYRSVNDMPPRHIFISPFTRMTHDWHSYLIDSPQSPLADVKHVVGGGGARTFKGFNTNSQTFAFQQYDQTLLKRTGTNRYELVWPDGSKNVFGQPDGSVGASRRVYLTQIVDPAGNALTLTYDQDLRLVAVTDAIGQVTTLTYGDGTNLASRLLTRVTDPFGRFAAFDYEKRTKDILMGILQIVIINPDQTIIELRPFTFPHEYHVLTKVTDMLGLSSQLEVSDIGGDIPRMITPYGTTTFVSGQGGGYLNTTRFFETHHPDGSRERVEYNQSTNLISDTDPVSLLPVGMNALNHLHSRNTYYWSRTACASSYGDYSKARIYHWQMTENAALASGILESVKEPLENRVWFNYPGQPNPAIVGRSDLPTHLGRVLEDGQTQLHRFSYNGFGHLTNSVDPLGRTLSYFFASNGIDLLEVRQTRAGNNELLLSATYNDQHLPLTIVDASGQTNAFTYNTRGQPLTATNPKGETTSYTYDADGYLIAADGPLPGTNDVVTTSYDVFGRLRTATSLSGYAVTFDYDALDRVTRITHPDATFSQFTYQRLDLVAVRDRAGRQTLFEYDNMGQMKQQTDPLGRVTRFDWCRCGDLKSLVDPMGRTTSWFTDVQGRSTGKQYADGSRLAYSYDASGRLRQVIDEKQQVTEFTWNRDDTLQSTAHFNVAIPTPGVSFTYDPDYQRVTSMTDGVGITRYAYNPITSNPTLGAGAMASVDGPLANDTITYRYDELGRRVSTAINGVATTATYDAVGRMIGETNALGIFTYAYDGSSGRVVSQTFPNGQTTEVSYGGNQLDRRLQRITHQLGATMLSEFVYGRDVPANRITTWSQRAGTQPPSVHTFGCDAVNQLLTATVTDAGALANQFAYTYDPGGNRLTEQIGAATHTATYNALNQINTGTAPGASRTNEWDAMDRLVAVNAGSQRTEFTYDGLSRMTGIRKLVNGSEVSHRRFVWCGGDMCEERDAVGVVKKRFLPQGVKVESGPSAENYYYSRDHLGSVREVTDTSGSVRARHAYDPYGRATKLAGDFEADFGFAGMFWSSEVNLSLTHYRAYDPDLGRWLSRDPLDNAETEQGPNLYAYVSNDPVNQTDPLGLAVGEFWELEDWVTDDELRMVYGSSGQIAEVEEWAIRPIEPWQKRPGGDLMVRPKGELALWRPPSQTMPVDAPRRVRRPIPWRPVPRPTLPRPMPAAPSTSFAGLSGAAGGLVGSGLTVLTMTDCNTAEGIFALVRQGKGGMANKHADKLFKQIKKYL
jgi:RHS repeat-associated protein